MTTSFFASQHEYLLVYAKNIDNANIADFNLEEKDKTQYNKNDGISFYAETSLLGLAITQKGANDQIFIIQYFLMKKQINYL